MRGGAAAKGRLENRNPTKMSDPPRRAAVFQQDQRAGPLAETKEECSFQYADGYHGIPVSLTLTIRPEPYLFSRFPPVFEGLLPEGMMRDALLRRLNIDEDDHFSQLISVGGDLVGSITVFAVDEEEEAAS